MKENKIKPFKIFNTLSHKIEELKPLRGQEVGIYACGPTVYDYQHIGNYRTYIMVDEIQRILPSLGYRVKLVMNITDVGHLTSDQDEGEDKVEKRAKTENTSAIDIARKFEGIFVQDLKDLNVQLPQILPRATDHIPEMISLIKEIEANGFTYQTDDGVYFDTSLDGSYGQMAGLDLAAQRVGERVVENPQKKHPADFALWKFSRPDENRHMEWDSPWGKGFPGWHIECSAMSQKYLGVPFDIHTGGIDHIPVHHTNEIAQTQAASGKKLAEIFVHFEFLLVDGRKMAKSDGTFITPAELKEKGMNPRAFRYLCLTAHYRDKLNFTWDSLKAAQNALTRLDRLVGQEGSQDEAAYQKALEIVSEDLALPKFLAFLEEQNNPWLWRKLESVHGLNLVSSTHIELTPAQKALADQREQLRQQKNFEQADLIRKQLEETGIVIEDTQNGPVYKNV